MHFSFSFRAFKSDINRKGKDKMSDAIIRQTKAKIADIKALIAGLEEHISDAKRKGESTYSYEEELRRQKNEAQSLEAQIRGY